MFANRSALLVGLVWVPAKYEDAFFAKKSEMSQHNLNPMVVPREHQVYPELTRPTYFENNDFTGVFQLIIDTYGIPLY